ncbi:hypothetical protein AB0F18_33600 [Streptomyces sp. NPDC029216]|uniref:hypothetical protein n=1 Tax=Streptomyces sp. NPDC029216 TaxID=3154701 RepID=UPI00340674FD
MKYQLVQILGLALLVVGGQGAIRQLIDPGNAGFLSWLPGGFPATMTVYIGITVVGATLAAWAQGRTRAAKAES